MAQFLTVKTVAQFLIGLVVSGVLIYFSLEGVDLREVGVAFARVSMAGIVSFMALNILVLALRSYRWMLILPDLPGLGHGKLFAINAAGYLAIATIPARLGDLVRVYLLRNGSGASLMTLLASTMVERLLDLMVIVPIVGFVALGEADPGMLAEKGKVSVLALFAVAAAGLCGLQLYRWMVRAQSDGVGLQRIPAAIQSRILASIRNFGIGLNAALAQGRAGQSFLATVAIWGLSILSIYVLLEAARIPAGFLAATSVLLFIVLGVSLPSAPGFVGTIQFACVLALSLHGVPKADALSFSFLFHGAGLGMNVLVGLLCLPFVDLRRPLGVAMQEKASRPGMEPSQDAAEDRFK